MHYLKILLSAILFFCLLIPLSAQQDRAAWTTFRKHLDAVENKDTTALKSTLDVAGDNYHLILPDGSQMHTTSEFYAMHVDWFQQPGWTMDMKIVDFEEVGDVCTSFVEANYREADRNGKPYHHKMWITYFLRLIGDEWKVVHDHASTAKKSE